MTLLLNALLGVLIGVAGLCTVPAAAQTPPTLAVVRPVRDCAALARADVSGVIGASTSLSTAVVDTAKGQFCQVKGTIAPAIGFEVDLPVAKWKQRFFQAGCGGLCGSINASIVQAGNCLAAMNGEFVVAASDLGHQGRMGSPTEGDFVVDRANHLTALAAKVLIRAYYGRAQRYAYFSGCSDGGRPRGDDGGAALPRRLRRHFGGCPGNVIPGAELVLARLDDGG